jgi:hypothetical protein
MRLEAATDLTARRIIALTAVYVLVLQSLFSAGAQLRVLLSESPGLCTILGYEGPGTPGHKLDVCAQHCVGHASLDSASLLSAAILLLGLSVWAPRAGLRPMTARKVALAYRGRAPPRL